MEDTYCVDFTVHASWRELYGGGCEKNDECHGMLSRSVCALTIWQPLITAEGYHMFELLGSFKWSHAVQPCLKRKICSHPYFCCFTVLLSLQKYIFSCPDLQCAPANILYQYEFEEYKVQKNLPSCKHGWIHVLGGLWAPNYQPD